MYEPEWRVPASKSEALAVLAEAGPGAMVVAGGTDVSSLIRKRSLRPPLLVDLGRAEDMRTLDVAQNSKAGARCLIGATVTHATLARDPGVARAAAVLSAACRTVGGPQIRARGTIGGNVSNASPAADGTVALFALGASAVIESEGGARREVPLAGFLTGPGKTILARDELVTAVAFDRTSPEARGVYRKVGQRNALAIAVVSVAVVFEPDEGTASIALGSVAPTPIRATEAEKLFADGWGAAAGSERGRRGLIDEAARTAVEAMSPIDDVRASAWYRTVLAEVRVRRALAEASE